RGDIRVDGKDVALPLAPGFGDHAAEAGVWERDLEAVAELGLRGEYLLDLLGIGAQLLEARVRGHIQRGEDGRLILVGCGRLGGKETHAHGGQREGARPDVDEWPRVEGPGQCGLVAARDPLEDGAALLREPTGLLRLHEAA